MASKQLAAILSRVPAATALGEEKILKAKLNQELQKMTSFALESSLTSEVHPIKKQEEEESRIVARIPQSLKDEIRILNDLSCSDNCEKII